MSRATAGPAPSRVFRLGRCPNRSIARLRARGAGSNLVSLLATERTRSYHCRAPMHFWQPSARCSSTRWDSFGSRPPSRKSIKMVEGKASQSRPLPDSGLLEEERVARRDKIQCNLRFVLAGSFKFAGSRPVACEDAGGIPEGFPVVRFEMLEQIIEPEWQHRVNAIGRSVVLFTFALGTRPVDAGSCNVRYL